MNEVPYVTAAPIDGAGITRTVLIVPLRHQARAMNIAKMKGQHGYTIIEVMIALTLLAIGTSGIIAMQKVTTIANRDAKNLPFLANQIARTWMDRLHADSVQWNHPSVVQSTSDFDDTVWLRNVGNDWFRPADNALAHPPRRAWQRRARHCPRARHRGLLRTNVRLAWLYGPPSPRPLT